MNRLMAAAAALVAVTLGASSSLRAGEYSGPGLSADLVIVDPRLGNGTFTGRYYFDRGGQRYELNGRTRYRALIFNRFSAHTITVSRDNSVRIDRRRGAALAVRLGDEPCGGFSRSVFLGSEARFGRTIQLWRCERPEQVLIDGGFRPRERVTVWFDTALRHFIRMESSAGTWIELRNIRTGRQPPALFEAPSDFAQSGGSRRIVEVEPQQ